MVSGPTSVGGSSMVRFRPDPGEPAVRLAAPPEQTALLVASQEQRNETRLRSRAISRGEDVLYSNRTFTLGLGLSSPVYNGGLTTLVSRADSNGFLPDQVLAGAGNNQARETDEAEEEEDDSAFSPQSLLKESDEPTEEELEQEEQELKNEDTRLSQNLARALMEQNRALENGDRVQLQQSRRKEQQLTREIENNEKEKREIELEKLEARMKDMHLSLGQAMEDNAAAAMGILDVMFGLDKERNLNLMPEPG